MPNKPTLTEQVSDLQKEVLVLGQRLGQQEELFERHEQSRDQHELAAVREVQARHDEKIERGTKDREESVRRWTQFALLAAGAVFTLFAQLVVQLLLRLLSK